MWVSEYRLRSLIREEINHARRSDEKAEFRKEAEQIWGVLKDWDYRVGEEYVTDVLVAQKIVQDKLDNQEQ